jgi:hypothetical protein
MLRRGHEVAFVLFHYSEIGSSPDCADPGGLFVNSLSLIVLGLRNSFGLGHAGAYIERLGCDCVLFHRDERQPLGVSEEKSGGSGPGSLPECHDPGGLMVNSLSLIVLGLRNSFGLGHAGACVERLGCVFAFPSRRMPTDWSLRREIRWFGAWIAARMP